MGRVEDSTTGKLDDEELFWERFHELLPPGDDAVRETFWSFVYGNRAAITNHLTANITEPVLAIMATQLQERVETVQKQMRELALHGRVEWQPFQDVLTLSGQRAWKKMWSYVDERHVSILAHGTPNIIEPILFSMILGVARQVCALEDLVARSTADATRDPH